MLIRPMQYLGGDFTAIKMKIDSDYNANQSIWQIFWTESTLDTRLEAGDSSLMAELNTTTANNNRGSYYFNRVRPLCNMVSGTQRRNRKSSIAVPLENGDQETADQWTKVLLHIFKKDMVGETISDAFHQGACVTGMNLLQVYMDWSDDPISGDVRVKNHPYSQFFIDPYFRDPQLSDCSFVWVRSYLTHSAAASLMPDKYDEIMALPGNPTGTGRDGRFQYMAESYGQTQQNRLSYDEYYYRDFRKRKILVDKETGAFREITDKDAKELDLDFLLSTNPRLTIITQDTPTVRLAIMIQDRVFYDGPSGMDEYPFVAVTGYYNAMMPYFYNRIQGICRSLRDPQILLNRRIILSADMLESQVNSGWIFKENAVIDVKHLFQTGQGRIIPLKAGAQMSDIMPIVPPQIPPSFFQIQETFSKELNMVSGINEELMGSAIDDKAGILAAMRQGAGLITLQPIFDKLDAAQKLLSEKIMKMVSNNYTPYKIKMILEGQEPAPQFYKKAFGKYHCQVQLGFDTESQRQMQFAQFLQLRELGVNIPDDKMIEAATIQNKGPLMQEMAQKQQAAMQQQQQQAQSQMQLQQAQVESQKAHAVANRGLGVERASRVQENQALAIERRAQADKDEEIALLNFIKAAKEIQAIDIDSISRIVELSSMLRDRNNVQQENR